MLRILVPSRALAPIRRPIRHRLLSTSPISRSAAKDSSTFDYAILGGGLSGLSLALFLSRSKPQSKIILLEKSARLGGWVHSQRVTLGAPQEGKPAETALCESGPRSIRPSGLPGFSMIELLKSLGLDRRMLLVPKTAPSARNRFIYYPDRLNKLPSSLAGLPGALSLPVLKGVIPALLTEAWRPSRFFRPKSESPAEVSRKRAREALEDESVEAFFRRRLGDQKGADIVGRLLSAVLHGIYAGDARKLSVRSVLQPLWETERRYGSLLRAVLPKGLNKRFRAPDDVETFKADEEKGELKRFEEAMGPELVKVLKGISVFSFPDGVQELTDAIVAELQSRPNVQLRVEEGVEAAKIDGDAVVLSSSKGQHSAKQLLASIPSAQLAQVLASDALSPALTHNPSANVGVVNVLIPTWVAEAHLKGGSSRLLPVEGFGYLIPRLTPNNEAGILGVVFDSDALPTQDEREPLASSQLSHDARKSPTKLTVMMGGPHWSSRAALPTEEQCKEAAFAALQKHLGLPAEVLEHPDTRTIVNVQRECIPHYVVGHIPRMQALHERLVGQRRSAGASTAWEGSGKLVLAGASYTGVSLNDIVLHARRTAHRLVEAEGTGRIVTGLEAFAGSQPATTPKQASLQADDAAGLLPKSGLQN